MSDHLVLEADLSAEERLIRDTVQGYATDREQFGGPIARVQLQQEQLAEMATQLTLDYSPMCHRTNMEAVDTYEGAHNVHTLILGGDPTGFAAYE